MAIDREELTDHLERLGAKKDAEPAIQLIGVLLDEMDAGMPFAQKLTGRQLRGDFMAAIGQIADPPLSVTELHNCPTNGRSPHSGATLKAAARGMRYEAYARRLLPQNYHPLAVSQIIDLDAFSPTIKQTLKQIVVPSLKTRLNAHLKKDEADACLLAAAESLQSLLLVYLNLAAKRDHATLKARVKLMARLAHLGLPLWVKAGEPHIWAVLTQ